MKILKKSVWGSGLFYLAQQALLFTVFGWGNTVQLPKAFGKIGWMVEPHLVGDFCQVTEVGFNQLGGPFQPDCADVFAGGLVRQGFDLAEKLHPAHGQF